MELIIAMTYGKALFDAAVELDKIDEIKEEIDQIDGILKKEEDYVSLLCNPAIPVVKKKAMIRNVFKGRVSEEVLSFLYILIDKDRMFHYHRIVKEYLKLMDEYRGEAYGKIYSTVPLSQEQLEKFETEAGKLLREKVKLRNKIDKSLLGGVKLLIDGKLIDASLRASLDDLDYKLKKL
ncbi:ATP synthase F1 subunit delta [Emergencia sp.]|uniref:ATP synthase F1 subunit delta n=1 Tax=Emergencia sp. TaxID=1926557 RepID=UPI003AEFF3E0